MAEPTPKVNPLAAFQEKKEKIGPHGFDSHIVVPSSKDAHSSGAVPVENVHGIRVLPNGASGMQQSTSVSKK